ncbi:hypothetical protein PM082_021922 [Marasmius tenuissimus]|nr:hypothetical protein PM082_021922 [Marasmius tenuissimus]
MKDPVLTQTDSVVSQYSHLISMVYNKKATLILTDMQYSICEVLVSSHWIQLEKQEFFPFSVLTGKNKVMSPLPRLLSWGNSYRRENQLLTFSLQTGIRCAVVRRCSNIHYTGLLTHLIYFVKRTPVMDEMWQETGGFGQTHLRVVSPLQGPKDRPSSVSFNSMFLPFGREAI